LPADAVTQPPIVEFRLLLFHQNEASWAVVDVEAIFPSPVIVADQQNKFVDVALFDTEPIGSPRKQVDLDAKRQTVNVTNCDNGVG
jgi:hypothetical protein